MGLFFTLLYILVAYLAPENVFGDLAQYHVELIIAGAAILFSVFKLSGSNLLKMTDTRAWIGLCAAVACSEIFNGWVGGGLQALILFVPNAAAFFLVFLNCRTKRHLQMLLGVLFFSAVFIVVQGAVAGATGDVASKYVLGFHTAEGLLLFRIRGYSFLGDPNDLAQFIVALIPCMFFFWAKGRGLRNACLVFLPVAFLLFGMYETHSRGGMVSLMVVSMVAGRRRIGTFRAAIGGLLVFAGLTAAGFSGGRDVAAGEDRVAAWSTGLELIRGHPVFGVGFRGFADYNDITAHNTFVVCAAELGMFGVFCWILFMLVTLRNAMEAARFPEGLAGQMAEARGLNFLGQPGARALAPPASAPQAPLHLRSMEVDEPDTDLSNEEIRRLSSLMVVSFAGFLTAGWFLSRAYTMVLFVNAGMAASVFRMARDRGMAQTPFPGTRAARLAALVCLALLVTVYVIVRVDHLLPK